MTSQECFRAKAKPGHWFVNVAPLGEDPDWREEVAPLPASNLIFGYTESDLMAWQRKQSHPTQKGA